MEVLLKIKGLSKSYDGKVALKDININIKAGRIIGLVGPNSSGKSTFLKSIAGLVKPTSGEIFIYGMKPGKDTKQRVAFLPDKNFLFKWMTVEDAVNFFRDFFEDFNEERANKFLGEMGFNPKERIEEFSKGMMEKLNLALVLSRKADFYILDEPLGSIDPLTRDMVIDTILENFDGDSTMLITTHLIRDIERLFDEVIFLKDGEVIIHEDAEELRLDKGKSIDEFYREVYK